MSGGSGADTIDGGSGADTSSYATSKAAVSVSLQSGTASGGDAAGDKLTNVENLMGSAYSDALTGNSASNVLNGGGGGDILKGLGYNDTYIVDNANDVVDESVSGSNGSDTVQSYLSINLADTAHFKGAVENVVLMGTGNTSTTGNALANSLTGNAGINYLDGGAGADTLKGLGGNDIYFVDNANDVVDESLSGSGGREQVRSSVSINLADAAHFKGSIEMAVLTGTGNTSVTGNALANNLAGNDGNNVLNGGAGADILVGGAGSDTLNGGTEIDTLTGGAGNDSFVFNAALSASNRDIIMDFTHGVDKFHLDNAVFTKLGAAGALSSAFFATGTAHDANDYIVYNQTTGGLFYDSNGSGSGGMVQFATLVNKPVLTAADFQVI